MKPFFSIVIPTYNRASIISKTIKSVLSQSFTNFEVLIIDDGSTDNTEEVVAGFSDQRIVYFKKNNAERGAARNFGVNRALGEYIFFLDSDDILFNNHLENAFLNISNYNNPGFFYSRYALIDEAGKIIGHGPFIEENVQNLLLKENPFACMVFLRSDVAKLNPFKEDRALQLLEDWLLWLQLCVRLEINFTNEITCAIVVHNGRSMVTSSAEHILKAKEIMLDYLYKDSVFSSKFGFGIKRIDANLTSLAGLQASIVGKRTLAIKLLFRAIKLWPVNAVCRRHLAIVKHSVFLKAKQV
ncbi:glycosyltransferase [Rufibacter latericius]|uniref:Glycosyltransferase n=1 Tax=Rufibacter latericius TaxID=2487040 RepID=A0A3M9MJR2_9BACT|nr:glycosyltransferase [Rufibacter latericius]RNI25754.1 glycosyltransferase [Rufibacter latericius]